MNARMLTVWFAVVFACMFLGVRGEMKVRLRNGTLFSGDVSPGAPLHWTISPYWSADPIPVPLDWITEIESLNAVPVGVEGVEIKLVGGTRLWMEDVKVDGEELWGRSSWGQRVRIPFSDVLWVSPPRGDTWNRAEFQSALPQQGRDSMLVGNQIMTHRFGQVAYNVSEWPEQFLLDVELRESSQDQAFEITCHGADPRRDPYFILRCYQDHFRITVFNPGSTGAARSMNFPYPLREGHPIHRVRVRGDITTGAMWLQVGDGEEMPWEFTASNAFVSMGERTPGILLQNRTQQGEVEVLRLRLMEWTADAFPPLHLPHSGVVLKDGSILPGQVRMFSEQKEELKFVSREGEAKMIRLNEILEWWPSPPPASQEVGQALELQTQRKGEVLSFSALDLAASSSEGKQVILVGTLGRETHVEIPLMQVQSFQRQDQASLPPYQHPVSPVLLGLLNGDMLRANFSGMSGSSLILQLQDEQGTVIQVPGSMVRSLRRLGRVEASKGCLLVELTNGCRLVADLMQMDEDHFQLKTGWSELLQMDRRFLKSMFRRRDRRGEVDLLTYDLQEWSLYADGTSRLQERPTAVGVGMDGLVLQTPGVYMRETKPIASDHFYLRIRFSGKDRALDGPVRIELNGFANEKGRVRNLTLQVMSYQIRAQLHGQGGLYERWQVPNENRKGGVTEIHVELNASSGFLRVDCGEGRVWKYPIQEWKFTEEKYPMEIRVGISGQGVGTMLRHMTLSENVDAVPTEILEEDRKPGRVLFRNGDRLEADLLGVEHSHVFLKNSMGLEVSLPLDRIQFLSVQESDPLALRKSRSHARFVLGDGEEEFLAEILAATSEGFTVRREGFEGGWMVPFSMIRRVEFNPYTP